MINLSQLIKGRKKLFFVISAISALILPSIWFGLGHVIAKQALAVPHGCGMWESNTPTNWTVDDDWESFEPWADSEQRIYMRKDFDADAPDDGYRMYKTVIKKRNNIRKRSKTLKK